VLRVGRQYLRPTSLFGEPFRFRGPGELVGWSRILADEEALCIVNAHGTAPRGGDVLVDADLNAPGSKLTVIANSRQAGTRAATGIGHSIRSRVPVKRQADGTAYVEIRDVPPSGVVVVGHRP
jgi:hypothetical protein